MCVQGVLVRKVSCIDSTTGTELQDMHACTELGLARPSGERVCEKTECPVPHTTQTDVAGMWEFGNWEPCSKTCGGGVQRRMVSCRADDCGSAQRPRDTVPCNLEPCPTWNFGAWGKCDRSCGSGYQHRQVRCQNQRGESLPDSACLRAQRPLHFRVCEPSLPSCSVSSNNGHKEFMWRSGGWGACTNTCGKGTRVRDVHCVKGDWRVHDQYCHQRSRPRSVRGCRKFDCPFTWSEGEWSEEVALRVSHSSLMSSDRMKPRSGGMGDNDRLFSRGSHHLSVQWQQCKVSTCSRTCGVGHQQRSVTCHRVVNGWPDPRPVSGESSCNHTDRPVEQQICRPGDCQAQFHWSFGDWQPESKHTETSSLAPALAGPAVVWFSHKSHSESNLKCSQLHGKCKQKRDVFCHHRNGHKVNKKHCPKDLKPKHRRKCPQKKCESASAGGFSSCLEIQQKLNTKENREYIFNIRGRNVSIYCYDMDSNMPKEYLTVPTGQNRNYAEIYNRRLQHPDTCPHEGQRRDDCDCIQDAKGIAGLTVYSKIRLNVTSLRVNTKDYMFAQQQSGQWVAYAEAGDCYSKHNCPQGRFNIDLVGTGFVVSPSTKWQEHGSQPSLTINWLKNHQVVDGKCGGYCGTCRPHLNTGLKLDVLPP
uniref:GON domain-containing protein n=1 Tax=Timema bartmani TaxID=61472 RepID=A0A7R9FA34_9NEOP|nr:unnamed protein product [Timema bartmani]